ncbi:MAG: BMP family ABC transporter substrate-binding protein [Lachnospiraceae bacterium]|nr:BMP family ABC transporter substrate-binding protein [Lachnospiraceae bacterium]
MDKGEYSVAYKRGQKKYRECVSRGEYPYLPVLNDMIPEEKTLSGTDIGLVQIPAEFIVGTKTRGRTSTFARNFMPIAEVQSEFAEKWERLCESHLTEGIRDPVKVYEYMNRFYVEEGNKRVSVLKYFGAVMVAANVIRILPERNGSPEIEIYYEYLEFYKRTKVNFIEFSKEGSYDELLTLMGKEKDDVWDEDEIRHLRSAFCSFKKVYTDNGGKYLRTTVGDAFLAYIRVYGYESLDSFSEDELKKSLLKMWEEVRLQSEEKPLEIKLEPEEKKKKIKPLLLGTKKYKIAFLYRMTPETLGWSGQHEFGRIHVQNKFADKIVTMAYSNVTAKNAEVVIEEAIRDGATIIFATAVELLKGCLKAAAQHPEVSILNCSVNMPHKLIRTYFPRTYEAKFISGALAGTMCDNNKLGYICQYPVFGRIAEINAFARGVQLVNPDAKVYLEWSSVGGDFDTAMEKLKAEGIKWISVRDDVITGDRIDNHIGLEYISEEGPVPMALAYWNWGNYYEKIIDSILNENFFEEEKTSKSLNYYWGMKSGVVEIIYSSKFPKGTRYLGELLARSIIHDECRPFYNPEIDEEGKIIWDTLDQSITIEDIVKMDWLEDNIVGKIPTYDELNERARELVDLSGVHTSKKPVLKGTTT